MKIILVMKCFYCKKELIAFEANAVPSAVGVNQVNASPEIKKLFQVKNVDGDHLFLAGSFHTHETICPQNECIAMETIAK